MPDRNDMVRIIVDSGSTLGQSDNEPADMADLRDRTHHDIRTAKINLW